MSSAPGTLSDGNKMFSLLAFPPAQKTLFSCSCVSKECKTCSNFSVLITILQKFVPERILTLKAIEFLDGFIAFFGTTVL